MNDRQTVSAPAQPAGWADLFRNGMAGRTVAISAGIGLHAFNEIAVAPVLPIAVVELDGVRFLPWAYSLFFAGVVAGGMTATPLRARLGPRRALLGAALLYLGGLLTGASATAIAPLLGGRLAQGLADGWIVALCYGLIPDLFPSRLIARLFAMEAAIWAGAAVLGPVASGLAAEAFGWRAGFCVSLPLLAAFAAVTPRVKGGERPEEALPAPRCGLEPADAGGDRKTDRLLLALCLLAALVFSLPSAFPGRSLAVLALPAGIVLFVAVLRADAARRRRLFPAQLFGFGSTVGRGIWLLFLMAVAQSVSTVFLAFALGRVFGLAPVWTGLVMVTMALSWSAAALPVGSVREVRLRVALLRAGPAFQALGFLLIAAGLSASLLPLVVAGQVSVGIGFGTVWGTANQAVVEDAAAAERAKTSALLPTVSTCGSIVGAGFGGFIATTSGFLETGGAVAGQPMLLLWGSAAAVACLALVAVQGVRPRQGE